jgi:uncharacterized protein
MAVVQVRQRIFSIAITSLGRVLLVRDQVLDRVKWIRRLKASHIGVTRLSIRSGKNVLDAIFVEPQENAAQASVLICHGIGETVQPWIPVQQLLAANGVASLVFDYSGYGRSSGHFSSQQSEQDAISAFHCLQRLTGPLPISVLGFSMGSAIAAAMIAKVPAHRLFLCAAFTSLKKAATSVGIPRYFVRYVPAVWVAEDVLRACALPVLIVHGEKDKLFPVDMAAELIGFCGSTSELVIVPKLSHNAPFRGPHLSYWELIISRLLA